LINDAVIELQLCDEWEWVRPC